MGGRCDLFQAFLGAFSKYLGERVRESEEKEQERTAKELLLMPRHIM